LAGSFSGARKLNLIEAGTVGYTKGSKYYAELKDSFNRLLPSIRSHLTLASMTLIQCAPGLGGQPIHQDSGPSRDGKHGMTMILFLNKNFSTAVCVDGKTKILDSISKGMDLSTLSYLSMLVGPGDVLYFDGYLPHCGVVNYADKDRFILFVYFSPIGSGMGQTDYPIYLGRTSNFYHIPPPEELLRLVRDS
jgi:ectoine hydroxylase-related dioxygenase (phytanoyl-CoA dioxygenase family)